MLNIEFSQKSVPDASSAVLQTPENPWLLICRKRNMNVIILSAIPFFVTIILESLCSITETYPS